MFEFCGMPRSWLSRHLALLKGVCSRDPASPSSRQTLITTEVHLPKSDSSLLGIAQGAAVAIPRLGNLKVGRGAYAPHLGTNDFYCIPISLYRGWPHLKFNDELHLNTLTFLTYAAFAGSRRRRACFISSSGSIEIGTDRPVCAL